MPFYARRFSLLPKRPRSAITPGGGSKVDVKGHTASLLAAASEERNGRSNEAGESIYLPMPTSLMRCTTCPSGASLVAMQICTNANCARLPDGVVAALGRALRPPHAPALGQVLQGSQAQGRRPVSSVAWPQPRFAPMLPLPPRLVLVPRRRTRQVAAGCTCNQRGPAVPAAPRAPPFPPLSVEHIKKGSIKQKLKPDLLVVLLGNIVVARGLQSGHHLLRGARRGMQSRGISSRPLGAPCPCHAAPSVAASPAAPCQACRQ